MAPRLRGQEAINRITGVSPFNFDPELRAQMDLPPRVVINDITLREGRQVEGVVLTPDECVQIAERLVGVLNVPMIQMGSYAPRDAEYMKAVSKALSGLGRKVRTEAMASSHQNPPTFNLQALFEAIKRAGECGFGVVICLATSADMLRACGLLRGQKDKSLDYLQNQELEWGVEAIRYAKSQKLSEVNVNFQDFLRADLDFLKRFSREVAKAGVETICMDDFGGGVGLPLLYKERFHAMKKVVPNTALGIHAHNTVGLAVASALAAFEGGCEVIDVGINGYGEGPGHVSLAETVFFLEFLYGYDTGIRLEKLRETAVFVADIMRQPLPKTTPLVGDNAAVFMHDKHHQSPEFPFLLLPFDPAVVGARSRVGFGEWAGPYGLKMKAASLGIRIPDDKIQPMIEALRQEMRWRKRAIADEEFVALASRVTDQGRRDRG